MASTFFINRRFALWEVTHESRNPGSYGYINTAVTGYLKTEDPIQRASIPQKSTSRDASSGYFKEQLAKVLGEVKENRYSKWEKKPNVSFKDRFCALLFGCKYTHDKFMKEGSPETPRKNR